MTNKKVSVAEPPTTDRFEGEFTKEQVLKARQFAGRRDLLNALLSDGKLYTTEAVGQIIKNFMESKVI